MDVAEPARTFGTGPVVELVEEAARARPGAGGGDGAHDAAGGCDFREQAETAAGKIFRHIGDAERVAKIGLVGAEFA